MPPHAAIRRKIDALETEMRCLGPWQSAPPTEAQFAFREAFARVSLANASRKANCASVGGADCHGPRQRISVSSASIFLRMAACGGMMSHQRRQCKRHRREGKCQSSIRDVHAESA